MKCAIDMQRLRQAARTAIVDEIVIEFEARQSVIVCKCVGERRGAIVGTAIVARSQRLANRVLGRSEDLPARVYRIITREA